MYLNASTDKIEIVLGGTVATNQLQWNVSYQDITSSGMTLPQSGGAGLTNNATAVDIVAAPAASTTRQVTQINVYNADTATATVTIQKDVSGTNYVLIRYALTTLDTLMWSREDGWRVMSGGGGGTTYTFSTGLTNTSGTVTANLSTGVAGGQSVVGGTAASNSLTLSSTSNATKGKILFGTSAYDEVNNMLGIGTQSPLAANHIVGDVTSGTGEIFLDRFTLANAPTFTFRKANGTIAVPSSVLSGDNLGVIGWRGYAAGAFSTGPRSGISSNSSQNWTGAAQGCYLGFFTTPNGSTTIAERMRIFDSGNVFIGASPTDAGFRLDVNGTARVQTSLDTPIVRGGTGASGTLTLSSTSNATKGKLLFGTSAYDEGNNRLGIGTASPIYAMQVVMNDPANPGFEVVNNTAITNFAGLFEGNAPNLSTGQSSYMAIGRNRANNNQYSMAFFYSSNGSTSNRVDFTFYGQTPSMSINANKNVLIGTTTDAGFRLDVNGTARFQGNVTISTKDIITDTTTGSKIATGNTQKLGFWNATPIAQPTTAVAAATLVGGGGTTLTDTDTFDGYTLAQVVKALRNAGLLA